MKTNLSTMNTLIELATEEVSEAAVRLGHAVKAATEAEEKLTLLMQYQDDYAARFQADREAGMTAKDYRNYTNFIEKLDQAIKGQQMVVQDARRQTERKKAEWQECERKRASYETLATRTKKAIQKKEDRKEQKETDEFANRKSLKR